VEVQLKGDIYFVSGDITETCNLGDFGLYSGQVKFDLSNIRTINSTGVREWINWIGKLKISPIYLNCPQSVVMQFNMVKEFLSNNAKVESFQIPAYCENCGEQKVFIMKLGKEYFIGKKLDYELPKCEKESCSIESDVDFESYFYFIENLK